MIKVFFAVLLAIALTACTTTPEKTSSNVDASLPAPTLEKIAEGVWIHKSHKIVEPWGPVLSQGLVIQTDAGVVLIDTTWDNASTKELLGLIKIETGATPIAAVLTHAHSDKMGGMDVLHEAGIKTFAHKFTNEDARTRNLTPARHSIFKQETTKYSFTLNNSNKQEDEIMLFYPGTGHARDNIVAYFRRGNILFGGCLIRPGKSGNLGNTADGDVSNWANAVQRVAKQFPDAKIIIPSHGAMGGPELLLHTIALAEAANE